MFWLNIAGFFWSLALYKLCGKINGMLSCQWHLITNSISTTGLILCEWYFISNSVSTTGWYCVNDIWLATLYQQLVWYCLTDIWLATVYQQLVWYCANDIWWTTSTWFTRPFLLVRGWGQETRLDTILHEGGVMGRTNFVCNSWTWDWATYNLIVYTQNSWNQSPPLWYHVIWLHAIMLWPCCWVCLRSYQTVYVMSMYTI